MLPLNDSEPNRYGGFPWTTAILIAANVAVLAGTGWGLRATGLSYREAVFVFGSVPRLVTQQLGGGALASLTSMFMHAGGVHLFGNMLFLWVYGRRVEDACGHGRFLAFYLACGLCADLLSTVGRLGSSIPSVGASGAVSGVMGAYLLLFPHGRIRVLSFVWFIPLAPRVRAFWLLFLFLGLQLFAIYLNDPADPVNYWAHLGGFFSGLLVFFFLRPEAFARYFSDVPV